LYRLSVTFLFCFALGAPEGARQLHQIVAFGFGDQARQRQQFSALLLGEARQVRPIRLDGAQHPHAGLHIVVGQGQLDWALSCCMPAL
jgi:hypothetical protein